MTSVDIAIIGAGPAGLSAGIYAARAKRRVMLLERSMSGGQQATSDKIDNYPGTGKLGISGVQLSQLMEEQATAFGVEILNDNVTHIDLISKMKRIHTTYNGIIEANAVILATGRDPRPLGIADEDHYRGRGLSYCAICDGPFFRDKDIAVVGGGNSAIEEALYLTKYASSVTIVHRRHTFRADKILQEKAQHHPKIRYVLDVVPIEMRGNVLLHYFLSNQTGGRSYLHQTY